MRLPKLPWGALLLLLCVLPPGASLDLARRRAGRGRGRAHAELLRLQEYSLHDFVRDFGRSYVAGTAEWAWREEIFQANMEELTRLRSIPSLPWTPGVTQFMDYTGHEYSMLLGYKGRRLQRGSAERGAMSSKGYDEAAAANGINVSLPSVYSVPLNGVLSRLVRNQGMCGSCWAIAAISSLEGLVQRDADVLSSVSVATQSLGAVHPTLSSQALVNCVKNDRNCGGTGGCQGATSELAFQHMKATGVPLAHAWPYRGADGACDDSKLQGVRVKIRDFHTLPRNRLGPLKERLVGGGAPAVVSVDATNWLTYSGGVYSDTRGGRGGGDFIVNHAVALMGYREPPDGYWLIKNSWGKPYGEEGFIRIELKPNEEQHCGWDTDTRLGIACDGDPDRDWVCGTCGILYDSSYPEGSYVTQ